MDNVELSHCNKALFPSYFNPYPDNSLLGSHIEADTFLMQATLPQYTILSCLLLTCLFFIKYYKCHIPSINPIQFLRILIRSHQLLCISKAILFFYPNYREQTLTVKVLGKTKIYLRSIY